MRGGEELGSLLIIIILFALGIGSMLLIFIGPKYLQFKSSKYKEKSGNSFSKTLFDKGNYGEFLTFRYLEKLNGHFRLLTNLYVPKKDGKTTEVDLVMLSERGVYVFESKNYSGWIFGNEQYKTWTQTLENKQKHQFYNPIWQNNTHINAIKFALELDDENMYKSYIVFSERCTLKKINVTSKHVKVMKRNHLLKTIKQDIAYSDKIFSPYEVDQIFKKLQQYSLADASIKEEHVRNIQRKIGN